MSTKAIPTVNERSAGKIPTTGVTNELARAIQAMAPMLRHGQVPGTTTRADYFWAVVTDTGPQGTEDDYTDERYWIRRSFIDGTDAVTEEPADDTTPITTSFENTDADDPIIFTATNAAEMYLDKEEGGIDAYQSGTHLVPQGARVFVFYSTDNADENGQNVRYFFIRPVQIQVLVTSAAAGGGKYYGKLVRPVAVGGASPSGDLSTAELGLVGDDENCLILNWAEQDQTTHDLTEGSPISQVFPGTLHADKSDEDPPKHVVSISGFDIGACSTPS